MPKRLPYFLVALCAATSFCERAKSQTLEVFAKASASKNHLSRDSYTVSISGATGLAILVIPQVRIEGRCTVISQLQNKQEVYVPLTDGSTVAATVTDNISQTNIYSVGFDIDLLSDKHSFQPFVYIGAGYIETRRHYKLTAGSTTVSVEEPKSNGVSGNLGAGFRIRIARSIAFEIEAFGYGQDVHKPNPLVNLYGSAGIRIFM